MRPWPGHFASEHCPGAASCDRAEQTNKTNTSTWGERSLAPFLQAALLGLGFEAGPWGKKRAPSHGNFLVGFMQKQRFGSASPVSLARQCLFEEAKAAGGWEMALEGAGFSGILFFQKELPKTGPGTPRFMGFNSIHVWSAGYCPPGDVSP